MINRKLFVFIVSIAMSFVLFGCSTETPLKAPCDWSGSNCNPKVKINQWDNSGN